MKNREFTSTKGFTLLEVMVVVAIISIMSAMVTIGFGSFFQEINVSETAGVLSDTIKKLELEIVQSDYQKNTVYFEENFIVVASQLEGQTLTFSYNNGGCEAGEIGLNIDNSSDALNTMYLTQKDGFGNNVELMNYAPSTNVTTCFNFNEAEGSEWQFQLYKEGDFSGYIRPMHFNLNRTIGELPPVFIASGTDYSIEISAPYAKKEFYENGFITNDEVTLSLEGVAGDTAELNLQE